MRVRGLLASLLLLPFAQAHAQAACPWLTVGTAAAALGGMPNLVVKVPSPQEGSCVFSIDDHSAPASLEITVAPSALKPPQLTCPSGSPSLATIGNGAVICSLETAGPGDKQLIVGRVRTVSFSVMLMATPKAAAVLFAQKQRDTITMIEEQVAGNLY